MVLISVGAGGVRPAVTVLSFGRSANERGREVEGDPVMGGALDEIQVAELASPAIRRLLIRGGRVRLNKILLLIYNVKALGLDSRSFTIWTKDSLLKAKVLSEQCSPPR
jgi:hypothetical protein